MGGWAFAGSSILPVFHKHILCVSLSHIPVDLKPLPPFFPLEMQFPDSFLKDLRFNFSPLLSHQAWALFKGKFREGIVKPDPPTWKTRLRCALNKSNDFEELVDRSQLDISDPYKVYRIVPEGAKKGGLPGLGPPALAPPYGSRQSPVFRLPLL